MTNTQSDATGVSHCNVELTSPRMRIGNTLPRVRRSLCVALQQYDHIAEELRIDS